MSWTLWLDRRGLAKEIGRLLNWEWEPVLAPWNDGRHPSKIQSPYSCRTRDCVRLSV